MLGGDSPSYTPVNQQDPSMGSWDFKEGAHQKAPQFKDGLVPKATPSITHHCCIPLSLHPLKFLQGLHIFFI